GDAARHAHRRPHHGRAAQRPQPARDVVVLPADRDRGGHHRGRARGLDAQAIGQVREEMMNWTWAVGAAAAAAALAGCAPRAAPRAEAPRVALVLKTLNSPFFIA